MLPVCFTINTTLENPRRTLQTAQNLTFNMDLAACLVSFQQTRSMLVALMSKSRPLRKLWVNLVWLSLRQSLMASWEWDTQTSLSIRSPLFSIIWSSKDQSRRLYLAFTWIVTPMQLMVEKLFLVDRTQIIILDKWPMFLLQGNYMTALIYFQTDYKLSICVHSKARI